jgi:hypothetical protein
MLMQVALTDIGQLTDIESAAGKAKFPHVTAA